MRPYRVLCLVVAGPWFPAALAQTAPQHNAASVTDAYGNARPVYLGRRSAGLFQSEAQRQALRGFQTVGRRVDRRGGFGLFSLPGDTLARPGARLRRTAANPLLVEQWPAARRKAYMRYGGFGSRGGGAQFQDAPAAFERRFALVAATSFNAPVYRALRTSNIGLGLVARGDAGPVPQPAAVGGEGTSPAATIDERLQEVVNSAHQRIRREAWAWFRQGEYRRAVRAFEAATSLEPSDAESRIGELFSHVSLGAIRTALVVQRGLTQREDNPFLFALNLSEAMGDPLRARELRTGLQLSALDQSPNPDFRALRGLMLWYLGDHDQAITDATTLTREFPSGEYADWPAKMRDAKAALAARKDTLQP